MFMMTYGHERASSPLQQSTSAQRRLAAIAALAVSFAIPSSLRAQGMVTAAEFAVTESGAATMSIPIQVPRGIGGMEPQLTLNYSSGAGNGLLGIGWSLQGPSAITRCPRAELVDGVRGQVNFDTNDRFCLEGQRLIKIDPANRNATTTPGSQNSFGVAGSEYRTERDGFSRIKATGSYGGASGVPAGFLVHTKSGLIMHFGNTTTNAQVNSHVLSNFTTVAARANTVSRWMLRRIADRLGNSIEYFYCAGNVGPLQDAPAPFVATTCDVTATGSVPVHYIRYTNRGDTLSGTFGVVFRYGTRPDTNTSYHAGSATRQMTRLTSIQTYVNFAGASSPGTPVKSYDLYYEPVVQGNVTLRATTASRLSAIQERAANGETLPALAFNYGPDSVFGMLPLHVAGTTPATPAPPKCGGVTNNQLKLICP